MICHRYLFAGLAAATSGLAAVMYHVVSHASEVMIEPVQACVIARDLELTAVNRERIAQCLGWQEENASTLCRGSYKPIEITPLSDDEEVRIMADNVSFYREGRSELSGNVEVQQTGRVVNAQTAYVYRDAKTNQVTQIELLGSVKYLEADRLMIARKATINPQDKSGKVEDVLYRFNSQRRAAVLPSWGRASLIERFANKDYFLEKATYTTCQPQNDSWHIGAKSIKLNNASATGVARHAKLYVRNWPILYTPYLSFPTSKERKSGFLMPVIGSSNVGGFDLALPYYWNIAPNYDATITPHLYTNRGMMMEGQYRYLSLNSYSTIQGSFLGHDKAYNHFLRDSELQYPSLRGKRSDRWSVDLKNSTAITQNVHLGINFQQVSDDYFLEDFSTNFAIMTARQLLRQADLSYTTDHWFFKGMAQSYQTLHPINQTPVAEVYQRLPQLLAAGSYDDLPFNASFSLLGQYDNFIWPVDRATKPEGPRYHLNPILSLPQIKPWGYFTPSIELVENYYDLNARASHFKSDYNRLIPRYYIDSGLNFERRTSFLHQGFTQTLEPRLFYLNVPYRNQTPVPVFDSGYMIFNADQLFRTNRFSGFDRIGDANQLSYALSSRWLSDVTGGEKASFTLGQIRYFDKRKVLLCQNPDGHCHENPLTLGLLSTTSKTSPVVGRALYHFNSNWVMTGDYAWDPATRATNNGHVNFHYEPEPNKILVAGYSYLVNGDVTRVAYTNIEDNPLNQITFSYAWPFSAKWSSLGGYNYNISKRYEMMSFLGVQYDNCCWAVRLIGGRAFRYLDSQARPHYNNNVYLQILLKGLGSVGNSDPASRLRTFIPGYMDQFHR
ncbi:Organic solvent tolerance protein [Legionella massiliensis]|uniref:LPS-assembly protein LptD n=1 Tax=Legionella massiliensis TaxID=1034943 RepID=A0A078KU68_9GAMM|nr:LPS-assembly protein LptD [Legionella massiliensis]CDZ76527.1 Organic solvent tolerance protein [Legionella massiliensis]CEE12265.1 LPS-assembly protein LptD precursor [Legionella massiliensis]